MQDLIDRYIQAWNETDPQLRRALVEQVWAKDATYIDPLAEAHGRDDIDALFAGPHAQFPDMRLRLMSPVDAHHRQARFSWGLGLDGAEPIAVGFDVAVADDDSRLVSVYGFLDKVPA